MPNELSKKGGTNGPCTAHASPNALGHLQGLNFDTSLKCLWQHFSHIRGQILGCWKTGSCMAWGRRNPGTLRTVTWDVGSFGLMTLSDLRTLSPFSAWHSTCSICHLWDTPAFWYGEKGIFRHIIQYHCNTILLLCQHNMTLLGFWWILLSYCCSYCFGQLKLPKISRNIQLLGRWHPKEKLRSCTITTCDALGSYHSFWGTIAAQCREPFSTPLSAY